MGKYFGNLELSSADRSFYRIRIVHSLFNEEHTHRLLEDSRSELKSLGIPSSQVKTSAVPGALEIPFLISSILNHEDCDGVLALGCVVRGKTYHFEIVANDSARGIREVSCKKNVPCINGILTVENEAQAYERSVTKGREFAQALIYMVDLSKQLQKEQLTSS